MWRLSERAQHREYTGSEVRWHRAQERESMSLPRCGRSALRFAQQVVESHAERVSEREKCRQRRQLLSALNEPDEMGR